jgi:hypothetical protein
VVSGGGDNDDTGLAAESSEMEEGVGRKDAGVLRDGKTSFSGKEGLAAAAVAAGSGALQLFTSSMARLGPGCAAAVFRANSRRWPLTLVSVLLTLLLRLLRLLTLAKSPSSAHSSAASKYAGDHDGLVFRPPSLLVSPTCSDPSTITARLPATFLSLRTNRLGFAGLKLVSFAPEGKAVAAAMSQAQVSQQGEPPLSSGVDPCVLGLAGCFWGKS